MSVNAAPLEIKSGQGAYPVFFPGDFAELNRALSALSGALVVIDRRVAELHEKSLASTLAKWPHLKITASEEEKTLAGVTRVLEWMQTQKATKRTTVVAIGGGITQDIATFACHVYYRGLRCVLVPTTLLSMSDSCIGAKVAVNFNSYKNQLGFFHSPAQVLIHDGFVSTLSDRDVASGYGEILKLALTEGEERFSSLERQVSKHGFRGPELPVLIRQSLETKKKIIELDEYETDLRRILNYGHTFGHALESLTHYAVPHGAAVAWGIDLVNFIAARQGLLAEETSAAIRRFIRGYFVFPDLNSSDQKIQAGPLIDEVRRDKKAGADSVNLILLARMGSLKVCPTAFDARLEEWVRDFLKVTG